MTTKTTPERYLSDPTYTQDQRMKDMLLCEDTVWPLQSARQTRTLLGSYFLNPAVAPFGADDYMLIDLSANSSYTFWGHVTNN